MSGNDQSHLLFTIAQGTLLWNWKQIFGANQHKWHTSHSYALAFYFHNGWKNRNMDVRVTTADDPSTSDKNLVNFGAVSP